VLDAAKKWPRDAASSGEKDDWVVETVSCCISILSISDSSQLLPLVGDIPGGFEPLWTADVRAGS
jgi:hypothetical protein